MKKKTKQTILPFEEQIMNEIPKNKYALVSKKCYSVKCYKFKKKK